MPTNQLTTVVGQTGELKRMVTWTANAWTRIQRKHDNWRFMRASTSWASVNGQYLYTLAQCGITSGTFRTWVRHNFRTYNTASGTGNETNLAYQTWEAFRDSWRLGNNRSVTSRPINVSIDPTNQVALGPAPVSGYTLTGDYWKAAVALSVDADVPGIPDGHDPWIIIHRAKMFYGAYWGAKEVYASGEKEYRALLRLMEKDQLPEPTIAGSLC